MARRRLDLYETAPWQTKALLAEQPIGGVVLEPCVGDGSIARVLGQLSSTIRVVTNDLDSAKQADYHYSAADPALYDAIGDVDWVITNPPYKMPVCTDIVRLAVVRARVGVAMMLRISFREPTAKVNPRGPFLKAHPIARLLTLPRYSFTGNGKSDSTTTEWAIWLKRGAPGWDRPAILSLYNADVTWTDIEPRQPASHLLPW